MDENVDEPKVIVGVGDVPNELKSQSEEYIQDINFTTDKLDKFDDFDDFDSSEFENIDDLDI